MAIGQHNIGKDNFRRSQILDRKSRQGHENQKAKQARIDSALTQSEEQQKKSLENNASYLAYFRLQQRELRKLHTLQESMNSNQIAASEAIISGGGISINEYTNKNKSAEKIPQSDLVKKILKKFNISISELPIIQRNIKLITYIGVLALMGISCAKPQEIDAFTPPPTNPNNSTPFTPESDPNGVATEVAETAAAATENALPEPTATANLELTAVAAGITAEQIANDSIEQIEARVASGEYTAEEGAFLISLLNEGSEETPGGGMYPFMVDFSNWLNEQRFDTYTLELTPHGIPGADGEGYDYGEYAFASTHIPDFSSGNSETLVNFYSPVTGRGVLFMSILGANEALGFSTEELTEILAQENWQDHMPENSAVILQVLETWQGQDVLWPVGFDANGDPLITVIPPGSSLGEEGQYTLEVFTALQEVAELRAEQRARLDEERGVPDPYTGIEGLEGWMETQFGLEIGSFTGAYDLYAIITEITLIPEGQEIPGSTEEITAILTVEYYDSSGRIRELNVGVAFQNENYGENGSFAILGLGDTYSGVASSTYVAGAIGDNYHVDDIVSINFGIPNATTDRIDGFGYTNDAITTTHPPGKIEAFAETGNPSELGGLLIPLDLNVID